MTVGLQEGVSEALRAGSGRRRAGGWPWGVQLKDEAAPSTRLNPPVLAHGSSALSRTRSGKGKSGITTGYCCCERREARMKSSEVKRERSLLRRREEQVLVSEMATLPGQTSPGWALGPAGVAPVVDDGIQRTNG